MNAYQKRAKETLNKIGTVQHEWTACAITDFKLKMNKTKSQYVWVPSYLVPNGYSHAKTEYPYGDESQCELCSHDMVYPYFIKHDTRKFYLVVGSTCVTHFDIKAFVKAEFRSWRKDNMDREWKDMFVPGMKIIRKLFEEHKLYLPLTIQMQSEYAKWLNSKNTPARKASAIADYAWMLDIIDEVDDTSTRKDVIDACNKYAPTSYSKKAMIHYKKKKVA